MIGNPFNSWLFLLDEAYKDKNEMEVLSDMTEGMKNFALRYNIAIDDPDLLRRYRMVEDGKRDVASQIQTAVDEASEVSPSRKLRLCNYCIKPGRRTYTN